MGGELIPVVGYGSLLSERSARETVPSLSDFRLVRVPGYRRIFNKVGVVFISRFGADPDSKALGSCATEPFSGSELVCSLFNCPEADFPALYEREHRFRWTEVVCQEADGRRITARMCTATTDSDYRLNKCVTPGEYQRRVGRYYGGRLWRDDLLPYPRYLGFCLQAAASHGPEVLDNFLTTSYLADGVTTLQAYLQANPALAAQCLKPQAYGYRG